MVLFLSELEAQAPGVPEQDTDTTAGSVRPGRPWAWAWAKARGLLCGRWLCRVAGAQHRKPPSAQLLAGLQQPQLRSRAEEGCVFSRVGPAWSLSQSGKVLSTQVPKALGLLV